MRDIKFRGKRVDGLGWACGYLVKTPITAEFNADGQFFDCGKGRICIVQDGVAHEIDPNTIGRFICKDDFGDEIYSGDFVKFCCDADIERNEEGDYVMPEDGQVSSVDEDGVISGNFDDWSLWTIRFAMDNDWLFKKIGNITDNPELMEAS